MAERRVKVVLDGDVGPFSRALAQAAAEAKAFSGELDTSTDRVANLTQSVLALGPALVPIAAAGVPAIAGLSNELGFAAVGAGVAVIAFQGLGKALDAVNAYQLEPTTANFQKMQQTMATLGPAGQDFVRFLQNARPEIQNLQNIAQAGLFPGVEDGLRSLSGLLPDVEHIIGTVSKTLGDLASEAGANLDSPKWHEFIAFLDKEARPTLLAMGRTAGNFAEGLANLWMAFAPLSNNFSASFLGLARDFSKWTDGLDKTKGFQDFVDYVNRVGPKAWDTLGALANALLQIVEAAAPVGEATLPLIKALADATASLAGSDLGPLVIGVVALTSAYARLIALGKVANTGTLGTLFGKSTFGGAASAAKDLPNATRAYLDYGAALDSAGAKTAGFASTSARLGASLRGTAKIAGGAGGLAFVMSGAADNLGLANTASLALAGSLFGPVGSAIGGGIGLTKDLASANDGLWSAVSRANAVLNDSSSSLADQGAAVDAARQKVLDLQNAVTSSKPTPTNIEKTLKNFGEGLFGKSDVEEANAALKDLETQQQKNIQKDQDQQFSEAGLSTAMAGATQATRDQTSAILDLVNAHNTLADQVLAAKDKEVAYEQAIDAATEAAKTNGATLDINTKAGQNNQLALDRLAAAWNDLDPATQNASGASERARAEFIKAAIQMGKTKAQAKKLADEYLHMPTSVTTTVRLQGDTKAIREAQAITAALKKIPHLTTTTIRTIVDTYVKPSKSDPSPSLKDMYLGGPRKADGGYITGPGGPRDDKIPAWLSNGEFVVNAAATRRNLGLLHSLNAQKFADGGPVNFSTATLSDSNLKRAIDKWQKALDANTTKLGTLKDQLKSFDDAVRDKFRTDPFNQGADVSGGGLNALGLTLASDTANATRFGLDLTKLKAKGISDGLFNALAASGDVNTADQLAALSKSGIDYYDKLYLARQRATSALGVQAGSQSSFGAQVAAQTRVVDKLERTLTHLRAEVKAGAEAGTKAGFSSAAASGQNRASNSVKRG